MMGTKLPMPLPTGNLNWDMIGNPMHECRGHCLGPLQCNADLVCLRCGYDNKVDRQVRRSTRDLALQAQRYAKGGDDDDEAEEDDEMREDEDDPDFDPHRPMVGLPDTDSDSNMDSTFGVERKLPVKSPRAKSVMTKAKAKKSNRDSPKSSIRKRQDALVDRKAQVKVGPAVDFFPNFEQKNDGKVTMRCMGSEADLIEYKGNDKGQKLVAKLVKQFPGMDDPDEIDADAVRAHCSVLMIKAGFRYGDSDGPAAKYARVIKRMMELHGGFKIKTQFKSANRGVAVEIASRLADSDKSNGKNADTSKSKLVGNHMCAFDKYCMVLGMEANGELNIDPAA